MKNKKLFICLIVFSVLTLSICVIAFLVNYFGIGKTRDFSNPKVYSDDVIVFNKQFEKYELTGVYTGDEIKQLFKIIIENNNKYPEYRIDIYFQDIHQNVKSINEININITAKYAAFPIARDAKGRINKIAIATRK